MLRALNKTKKGNVRVNRKQAKHKKIIKKKYNSRNLALGNNLKIM